MDPQSGYAQQDLIVGQTIGNYLVTQKLGEGGMGSVYLAEHPGIGKKVALKVLHSEFSSNEDVTTRFFNEAKAVNNIGHPNIVDIVDYGIIQSATRREQLVYFIMEYLAGGSLSLLIRNEAPLPPERALAIGLQVADALSASHKCGVVHRDLKPDNIMLIQRGRERDFVKLLDFGIAKLTTNAEGSRRTRTGIVMGTPAYMSPEQCDGRGNIDHRTDIYALGIVLYEMLVGRVPFLGEGYGEILVQHLTQPPIAPSQFRMVNPHIEAVVMKALEKRAELRFPNMDEMMRAMADPVGYVESHGGIQGFAQRQLMPSNAPVTTSVRLSTPSTPIPQHGMHPTPPPTQHYPYPHTPTPPPPGSWGTPTTLAGATGTTNPAAAAPRKKTGLILAALGVVVATVVAVVIVAQKDRAGTAEEAPPVSAESGVQPPQPPPPQPPPPQPPRVKVDTPPVTPGSAAVPTPGSAEVPAAPKIARITLVTKPAGATIVVNGIPIKQVTPEPFELPISETPVTVVLRHSGYKDITLPPLVPNEDVNKEAVFQKVRTTSPPPPRPPRPPQPPPRPPTQGSGHDPDGLIKPGT
jgi:eukaryotic-like serine/threonine-protein kinase